MIDTEALRRRMGGAIVGTRADGTQAVLIPLINARYLDLVRGDRYSPTRLTSHFVSLIRPGDRCEMGDTNEAWFEQVYHGFSGDLGRPFISDMCIKFPRIRPLPEPVVEAVTCTEMEKMRELVSDLCLRASQLSNLLAPKVKERNEP